MGRKSRRGSVLSEISMPYTDLAIDELNATSEHQWVSYEVLGFWATVLWSPVRCLTKICCEMRYGRGKESRTIIFRSRLIACPMD